MPANRAVTRLSARETRVLVSRTLIGQMCHHGIRS